MLNAVYIVISIFIMMFIGFAMAWRGWIDESRETFLSHLVIKIGLPALIISNMFGSYTRENLVSGATGLVIPFLSMGLCLALAVPLAHALRIPRQRQGVFCVLFAFSNSVFIGVPVSAAIFGDEVLPYTLLYYIANTIIFWSVGVIGIRRDGELRTQQQKMQRRSFASALKPLLNVPLCVFFSCIILILLGIRLPAPIMTAAGYVGNLVTPLSLFFIGTVLHRMFKKGLKWERGYLAVLIGRFIVSPALLLLISIIFKPEPIMRDVFLVQAAMPAMTQTSIVSKTYGADDEYATGGIAISTLFSLIFIPLIMLVIEAL